MLWLYCIREYCTDASCPVMTAGDKFQVGAAQRSRRAAAATPLHPLGPASLLLFTTGLLRVLRCVCVCVCALQYLWMDGVAMKKPTAVSAPRYVDLLLTWVESQLNDEKGCAGSRGSCTHTAQQPRVPPSSPPLLAAVRCCSSQSAQLWRFCSRVAGVRCSRSSASSASPAASPHSPLSVASHHPHDCH